MTSWQEAFAHARWSGSSAAILSGTVLAVCGKLERNSAAAPLNGPSQWLWGERVARRKRASIRETAAGYAIHHVVSIGWATVHEKYVARRRGSLASDLVAAGVTGGIACFMDYAVAHGRLRPGFEKHLSKRSLALVYGAFALGLLLDRSRSAALARRTRDLARRAGGRDVPKAPSQMSRSALPTRARAP